MTIYGYTTTGLLLSLAVAGTIWGVKKMDAARQEKLEAALHEPPPPPPRMPAELTIVAPAQPALAARHDDQVESIGIALDLHHKGGAGVPLAAPKTLSSERASSAVTFGFRMDDTTEVRIGTSKAELTTPDATPITMSWPDVIAAAPASPALEGPRSNLEVRVPVSVITKTRSEVSGTLTLRTDRAQRMLLAPGGVRFPGDAPARSPLALAYISRQNVVPGRLLGAPKTLVDIDLVAVDEGQRKDRGPCPDQPALASIDAQVTLYDRRTGAVRGAQTFAAPDPTCQGQRTTTADGAAVNRWLETFIQPPAPAPLAPPAELLGGAETKAIDASWKVYGISGRASADAFAKKLGEPTSNDVVDALTQYAWGGGLRLALGSGGLPQMLSFDGAGRNLLTDRGLEDPIAQAIGLPLADLTARYGKPTRYADGVVVYERQHGKDRLVVAFELIPGGQWQCRRVTVRWALE